MVYLATSWFELTGVDALLLGDNLITWIGFDLGLILLSWKRHAK